MSISINSSMSTYDNNVYSDTTKKTNKNEEVKEKTLSVGDYYDKLYKKFPDLKISIGDYNNGTLYSNGSSSVWGNIYLNKEYLEKATSDPETAKKLEGMLSGIPQGEAYERNFCSKDNTELTDLGFVIGPDGSMNAFGGMRMPATTNVNNLPKDKESMIKKIQEENKKSIINENHNVIRKQPKSNDSYYENNMDIGKQETQDEVDAKQLQEEYYKYQDGVKSHNEQFLNKQSAAKILQEKNLNSKQQTIINSYEKNFNIY